MTMKESKHFAYNSGLYTHTSAVDSRIQLFHSFTKEAKMHDKL